MRRLVLLFGILLCISVVIANNPQLLRHTSTDSVCDTDTVSDVVDDCVKEINKVIEETDSLIAANRPVDDMLSGQDSVMRKWEPLIEAIATIESRKNPKVVSRCGKYVGYLQISKMLVNECNMILRENKYTYNDRYDKQKSIEMFIVIQNRHNPDGNIEKAIRLWKSGDTKCMQRKARTESYYRKVMKILVGDVSHVTRIN